MRKNCQILLIQLFGMIFLWPFLSRVQAADLLVSPVNTYIQVDGGGEQIVDYTLINQEENAVNVTLSAVSFQPDDRNGTPQLLETLEFPYLSLLVDGEEVTQAVVPGGSELNVQVKLSPPLGTPVKEYPMTLFFVASDEQEIIASGTSLGMGVGSNLIVRLDDSNEDLSNLSLTLPDPPSFFVDTFLQTPFQVLVRNFGPFGTLINGGVVLRQGAREVTSWEFYPDLVLGESTRLARASDGSVDGNGNISLSSDIVIPRFLLGYYTLEAYVRSINAPDGIQTVATLHFLALPYWLLLLTVVLLVIMIVVKKSFTGKKKSRRQLDEHTRRLKKQSAYFR